MSIQGIHSIQIIVQSRHRLIEVDIIYYEGRLHYYRWCIVFTVSRVVLEVVITSSLNVI